MFINGIKLIKINCKYEIIEPINYVDHIQETFNRKLIFPYNKIECKFNEGFQYIIESKENNTENLFELYDNDI